MPAPDDTRDTTVLVGYLEAAIARRLGDALGHESRLCILASDLRGVEFEQLVALRRPTVTALGECVHGELLMRLKARQPLMGVLVLARDPSPLYQALLVTVGVRCVAEDASPRELLGAVGMRGLHRSRWALGAIRSRELVAASGR